MTTATRIIKADSHNAPARRIHLTDLSEATHSRFESSDFEPLALPTNRTPNSNTGLQSALTALQAANDQLLAQRDQWLDQYQHETVRLGIAIAERLLRRTFNTHPETVIESVRSALEWSVGAEHVRVRLHPADAELIASASDQLTSDARCQLNFVVDDSLSRGDCIVETPHGQIDARQETLLQRIADELLAE